MAKQDPKTPTSRMKSPFSRRGRTTNINELLGDDEQSSSEVGELGQAFRDALTVEPEASAPKAVPKAGKLVEKGGSEKVAEAPEPETVMDSPAQTPGENGVMLALNQIVENPKMQPRLRINEDQVTFLANDFRDKGQNIPILVRPVDGRENLYELIGGNHRYRAAQRIGWTHIQANIKRISFNDARIMSVVDNDALPQRSDYERAISYKSLLDDKIATSHRDVAEKIGNISKGRVTQCMAFFELPDTVLRILDDHPDLFSYRTANDLKKVIAKHADEEGKVNERVKQTMADGVMRLIDVDAPLSGLVHWIEQRLSGKSPFTSTVEPRIVLDKDGRTAFKTRARENSVVIEWDKKVMFKPDQIQEALMNVLKDLAQEAER